MEKFINEYTLELEGRLKQAEGLLRSNYIASILLKGLGFRF